MRRLQTHHRDEPLSISVDSQNYTLYSSGDAPFRNHDEIRLSTCAPLAPLSGVTNSSDNLGS